MPNSFSQPISLPCPRCGATLQAELYLIIDIAERPDLVEKIKDGTIHEIVCPNCGPIGQADAPLLIYRAGGEVLLFSPAQQTTDEQDQEHARALVARLRETLGPAWRNDWLARGLPGVPRPLLPLALSEDPQQALEQLQQQAAQALERLRHENPEEFQQLQEQARRLTESMPLLETLQQFIQADTWDESQRILEAHPELLEDRTLTLLDDLIKGAQQQNNENAVRLFQEHRALLERCRQVGIPRAFAEKRLPPDIPPELREVLQELAQSGVEIRSLEDLERALQDRPDLQEKLARAIGNHAESELQRRFQETIALQQRAENHPHLWPEVLTRWQALIEDARQQGDPMLAANAKGNLANSCLRLYEISGDEAWANQAQRLFDDIGQIFTRAAHPQAWGITQHSLGTLFLSRYERSGEEAHAQAAQEHYQNALEVRRRETAPSHWATVQHSLGNLFLSRYERSGEEAHAQAAQEHYWAILSQHKTFPLPLVFPFRSHTALARLHFRRKDWAGCVRHFDQAKDWLAQLLAPQIFRRGKESWLQETRGLPPRAAYACWKTNQPERAVEALESGRARLLGEALERQRRDLEALKEKGRPDLLERYRQAAERYDTLRQQVGEAPGRMEQAAPPRPPDWLSQVEAAYKELDAVIAEIQKVPGYETFLKTLTAGQIRELAADLGAPLVYLAATPAGGLALTVTAEGIQAQELPELTDTDLAERVQGPADDPSWGGYLGAYFAWQAASQALREAERRRAAQSERQILEAARDQAFQSWLTTLDATCAWLGQAVMGPVVSALGEIAPPESQVILIPGGWLALLPLHAARLDHRPQTIDHGPSSTVHRPSSTVHGPSSTYALDHYTFTYAPGAQALYHARHQAQSAPAETLLAVENPRRDLAYTPHEVAAVLEHFPDRGQRLAEKRATRQAVQDAIPQANVLHFSTHGQAGWGQAESARLLLSDGDLTLREVYRLKLDQARLAVLSACETALPGLKNPDEMVALPSGWMQAGVPGVVGTLWSVNDLSTAILIARFYDLWRGRGLPLPQALRQAQRWLRENTVDEMKHFFKQYLPEFRFRFAPQVASNLFQTLSLGYDPSDRFDHPYFWAGFIFVGL